MQKKKINDKTMSRQQSATRIKYLICIAIVCVEFFIGCSTRKMSNNTVMRGFDEKKQQEMLLGTIFREDLHDAPYQWMDSTFNAYAPDTTLLPALALKMKDVKIEIILGTWCSDSREQVPRLYKILSAIQYPVETIALYCVDRTKMFPPGLPQEKNVSAIPTIYFYKKDGTEIGNLVEKPETTLEQDMLQILSLK
jgi:hypothetical protein